MQVVTRLLFPFYLLHFTAKVYVSPLKSVTGDLFCHCIAYFERYYMHFYMHHSFYVTLFRYLFVVKSIVVSNQRLTGKV